MKRGGRKPGAKGLICSLEKIEGIKDWLLKNSSYRNSFLFYFGINTGLCISDILRLRVKYVMKIEMEKRYSLRSVFQFSLPTENCEMHK
ncbi:hypothetical protein [Bacillus thuringiensis]|uniref:hypothetical protein n=1 Tax=Bacillus thuringiensis TaxID=1428 RepID=UPI0020C559D8|nr:hypothetical protein [Bacillus thuringiensis]